MKKPVLVIMAAGMGSRYGGLKQIDPVDEQGHIIMDFSIFDAKRAGFEKVVFIIKKENEADFKEAVGNRMAEQMEVAYVYQDLHNIPEGLAVGILFGGVAAGVPEATIAGALTLALGIGLQNLPEGLAVSFPLRRAGMSKRKSFIYGQSSALVEPLSAVIGAVAVGFFTPALPYALAFAAGAMVFVVIEEVVPETQQGNNSDIATLGFIGGFIVMMMLDVALG